MPPCYAPLQCPPLLGPPDMSPPPAQFQGAYNAHSPQRVHEAGSQLERCQLPRLRVPQAQVGLPHPVPLLLGLILHIKNVQS